MNVIIVLHDHTVQQGVAHFVFIYFFWNMCISLNSKNVIKIMLFLRLKCLLMMFFNFNLKVPQLFYCFWKRVSILGWL